MFDVYAIDQVRLGLARDVPAFTCVVQLAKRRDDQSSYFSCVHGFLSLVCLVYKNIDERREKVNKINDKSWKNLVVAD
jgi:hypothetical protein